MPTRGWSSAANEWVVSEVEHLPLVSDELFAAAQERFRQRSRRVGARNGQSAYLFAGMVRCCSGHQPLAMYGRARKGHTYMTCDYGRTYGKVAADQIDGHGQWLSIREDALLPLVEKFFAERIFGPMRLDKLARQLRAHQKASRKDLGAKQAPAARPSRRPRPPHRPPDHSPRARHRARTRRPADRRTSEGQGERRDRTPRPRTSRNRF